MAGDRLVTTRFAGSTTLGFSAVEDPGVAVCLRPGTELAFRHCVTFSGFFGFLFQAQQHECLTARARRINEDNPLLHHDALEFGNGQIVLLTHLKAGQEAAVLQLPADHRSASATVMALMS